MWFFLHSPCLLTQLFENEIQVFSRALLNFPFFGLETNFSLPAAAGPGHPHAQPSPSADVDRQLQRCLLGLGRGGCFILKYVHKKITSGSFLRIPRTSDEPFPLRPAHWKERLQKQPKCFPSTCQELSSRGEGTQQHSSSSKLPPVEDPVTRRPPPAPMRLLLSSVAPRVPPGEQAHGVYRYLLVVAAGTRNT